TPRQRAFWSFQPVKAPPVPAVKDPAWPLTPIDNFVLARLEARRLRPVGPSSRRALIRRLTFDLTGLPPTPAEVDAFLADRSPSPPPPPPPARPWPRLRPPPPSADPWARHWLDLAHYADTAGETADYPVPDAWRYRNYVLAAFNADLPYNAFLTEQIAGDVLA